MPKTTKKSDDVVRAHVPGASDDDLRTITLAHPLSREQDFTTLGLPYEKGEMVPAGTKIAVRPDHAKSLISAGYAVGINADDAAAVRNLIRGGNVAATTAVAPAGSTNDGGTASATTAAAEAAAPGSTPTSK